MAERATFSEWIDSEERDIGLASGKLERLYEMRPDGAHFVGYTRDAPKAKFKANPNNSPAGITDSDLLAALGLSRFRNGEVSASRQYGAQVKIKEFGHTHRTHGLTSEQQKAVDAQIRGGANARQAAVRLGLTKSFVDAYLRERKVPVTDTSKMPNWNGLAMVDDFTAQEPRAQEKMCHAGDCYRAGPGEKQPAPQDTQPKKTAAEEPGEVPNADGPGIRLSDSREPSGRSIAQPPVLGVHILDPYASPNRIEYWGIDRKSYGQDV